MTPPRSDESLPDNWGDYRRYILKELERTSEELEKINQKIDRFQREDMAQVKVDIAMLQVKSGLWGALSGTVVVLATLAVGLLR